MRDQDGVRQDGAELCERPGMTVVAVLGFADVLLKLARQGIDDEEEIIRKLLDLRQVRRRVRLAALPGHVFERQRVDRQKRLENELLFLGRWLLQIDPEDVL